MAPCGARGVLAFRAVLPKSPSPHGLHTRDAQHPVKDPNKLGASKWNPLGGPGSLCPSMVHTGWRRDPNSH